MSDQELTRKEGDAICHVRNAEASTTSTNHAPQGKSAPTVQPAGAATSDPKACGGSGKGEAMSYKPTGEWTTGKIPTCLKSITSHDWNLICDAHNAALAAAIAAAQKPLREKLEAFFALEGIAPAHEFARTERELREVCRATWPDFVKVKEGQQL